MTNDAQEILVVNLPPLGCIPAILTLFNASAPHEYDPNGCLKSINLITDTHNKRLEDEVIKLRAKHRKLYFYFGDVHGVYSDILRQPLKYSKALAALITFFIKLEDFDDSLTNYESGGQM